MPNNNNNNTHTRARAQRQQRTGPEIVILIPSIPVCWARAVFASVSPEFWGILNVVGLLRSLDSFNAQLSPER